MSTLNYEFELSKAARAVACELALVKPGECVAITADTLCDERVINAVAGAVHAAGGKPLVMWYPTPLGVGKAADKDIPYRALGHAIGACEVWIEFGYNWILYSSAQEIALADNKTLRHVCLSGMDTDMLIRLVGRVEISELAALQTKLTAMTKGATHVKLKNPTGTELEFENDPACPFYCELGIADKPGSAYLSGQICWFPKNETINGLLTFDGSISPPGGVLNAPVLLRIERGYIKEVTGGPQAKAFETWLASFHDPLMYRLAHVCYGLHPGAKLCGNCLEDERIWGATEWGIGYLPVADAPPTGINAASHCDGITLNSSVWLDGVPVLDAGRVVHPELVEFAKGLHGD